MSKKSNQKLKALYILKILMEKTDEEHPMSTNDLIRELASFGISAERKSVYDDVDALIDFGIDIVKINARSNLYYIGEREFQLPELKLLVDTVQSSKFITHKKSLELIKKLEGFTSRHNAKKLQRQVFVSGRVKAANEQIYYNVDTVHAAILENKKISFKYFEWNVEKKQQFRRGGEDYIQSPLGLAWTDENYYLIAFSDERNKILHFRVDKMSDIRLVDERASMPPEKFDIAEYTNRTFGMYGGDAQKVTLEMTNDLVGVIIDRFGKEISIIKSDEEHFRVNLGVSLSPVFLSWLMSFGAKVRVVSPERLIDMVKQTANEVLKQYE